MSIPLWRPEDFLQFTLQRCYDEGQRAGRRGKPIAACHYRFVYWRGSWVSGWYAGRDEMFTAARAQALRQEGQVTRIAPLFEPLVDQLEPWVITAAVHELAQQERLLPRRPSRSLQIQLRAKARIDATLKRIQERQATRTMRAEGPELGPRWDGQQAVKEGRSAQLIPGIALLRTALRRERAQLL